MIKRTVIYHVLYILQNVNKNKDITFQKPVNNLVSFSNVHDIPFYYNYILQ